MAAIVVGERTGGRWDARDTSSHWPVSKGGFVTVLDKRRRAGLRALSSILGVLGHHQRLCILAKLLEGPATYRALQHSTALKAGPLYHHLNQLRLAGLILPKQRDLYELTRGGRNLILIAMTIRPVIEDTRRRPVPAT